MKQNKRVQSVKLTKGANRVWMWLATISMTIYILWRIFFTIPSIQQYGVLAFVCGILLVVAEAISALEAFLHYSDMHHMVVPEKPEIPLELYPDVDVFIATHNEEVSLLYKTANGCKHMHYPDPSKVHVYLCDDGNRPAVAELAKELGVGYLGLADNKLAKAGNLNNALSKTHSPYIATFDADMIPTSDFLMETIPYMFLPQFKKDEEDGHWRPRTEEELDPDFKMGFIQTPQSFYNPDLFQYFLYSEGRIPNEQDFFFREINVGRNSANAAIYAGSNTLIARAALDEVGGIATGTITEDFETGIRIQAAGYTCYAIDKPLAHGLAPNDFESLIRQRERWGRGCVYSMRHTHIMFNPKLKFRTKLSYFSALLYWFTFLRRFVYIMSPILFVVFHIPVVICDLRGLLLIWLPSFLLYNHALKLSSGKIRSYRWSNIIDTIIFPYLILPILAEALFIKLKKFHITGKSHTDNGGDLMLGLPHMILLLLDLVALVISFTDVVINRNYGGVVLLYWILVNGFNLVMALLFVAGRRNLRSSDRFRVSLPVEVSGGGRTLEGTTLDVSENGLALVLPEPVSSQENVPLDVTIRDREYTARLQCAVASVSQVDNGWKYGLRIDGMEGEDKENYMQIVFDRHHSMSNIMQPTVSVFSDLSVNIQKRMQPLQQSQRKLPRITIGRRFPIEGGGSVMVEDFNFAYLRVSDADAQTLPQEFTLNFEGYLLELRKSDVRPNLYEVLNRDALLESEGFTARLLGSGQEVTV